MTCWWRRSSRSRTPDIVRRDEPRLQARFIWAAVHGTAMLAIDGQLDGDEDGEALNAYAIERLRQAIAAES